MEVDEITGAIIDESIKIHRELGPGLLETVYEVVLARALQRRGFEVERQRAIKFEYDGLMFDDAFKLDLLVEGLVVVELKSVENIAPVHYKQLLTYLRLLKLPVGLLLNFGAATLKEGLKRVVNDWGSHQPSQLRINQRPTEGNHD
jgi:GxxExxY protein